jgi:hypothetical protein
MLEELPRRLINGVMWGFALTLVLKVTQSKDGVSTLRPFAKSVMKGAVIASEKAKEIAAEARETVGDIYAELQAEEAQRYEDEGRFTGDEEPISVSASDDESSEGARR